jgi:uncharacterized membrane protein
MRTRMALVVCSVVALGAFGMQAQDVGHAAAVKRAGIATISYLPSLGYGADALDINAAGTIIVGSAWDRFDLLHAVKWTLQSDGSWVISDLPWPADATSATARGVNDGGDVAGNDFPADRSRPLLWLAAGPVAVLGCRTDLGAATVYAISAQAQVVVGIAPRERDGFIIGGAAVWGPGGNCREDLPPLVDAGASGASAVNGDGTIVGGNATTSVVPPGDNGVPVRWRRVADQWLVEPLDLRRGWVRGSNATGDLAGVVYIVPCARQDGCQRAAIWHAAGLTTVLGTLGGEDSSAEDINDSGEVVGVSTPRRASNTAYFWSESAGMVQLPFKGRWAVAYALSDVRSDGTRLVVGSDSRGTPVVWVVRNP